MKYPCLLYLYQASMAALPAADINAISAGHLDLNPSPRAGGHFVEAEALEPARTAASLRVRQGKGPTVRFRAWVRTPVLALTSKLPLGSGKMRCAR
jgi:hypothetical protein